jgi:EpsI family protein
MPKWSVAIVNLFLLIAVAGSYWGRHIDAATVRQANFLQTLSVPFEGWQTSDEKADANDLYLLQPDSVLIRDYKSPKGEDAQLAVIAGHRKRSIHTPVFCLAGGGWETVSQQSGVITVAGRKIQTNRLVMTQNNQSVVLTYFFTDGEYCSPSLTSFQTVQMVKRFRSVVPMGALVRIIVPIRSTEERADALSDQFAGATLPAVLDSVRHAQLVVR